MRSNAVRCPTCKKYLVKIVGSFDYVPFTFGRVCQKCKILYLNPSFKEYKHQFNIIGGDSEKKKD